MGEIVSFKKKYPDSHEGYLDKFRDILKNESGYEHMGFLLGYIQGQLRFLPDRNDVYEKLLLSSLKSGDGTLIQKIIDYISEGKNPSDLPEFRFR